MAHEPKLFGKRGYAILFFANYMNNVAELPIHFCGVSRRGAREEWIAADAPETHPDWNRGGTYRHASADDISYDENHNFKLNVWSYDYPRFTKPFWYGRAARGMVFQMMFDRGDTSQDQVPVQPVQVQAAQVAEARLEFSIRHSQSSKRGKEGGGKTRGYRMVDFTDAFSRYLPHLPNDSVPLVPYGVQCVFPAKNTIGTCL